jgi:hypothetical protein
MAKIYEVLYAWNPGDAKVRVLGRVDGKPLALATGGSSVWLVNEANEKGWGFVDIREYRDDKPFSSRIVHISIGGNSINYDWPRLLPKHNELWFVTHPPISRKVRPVATWSLAMLDLNAAKPEASIVLKDAMHFGWSTDEQTLLVMKPDAKSYSLLLLRRKSLNQPPIILAKDINATTSAFSIADISYDGRIAYFVGYVGATSYSSMGDHVRIYKYKLPPDDKQLSE